jgi:hypothetical protein
MKLLLLTFLLSTSVFATEYCQRLSFTSGKLECLKLASDQFVDDKLGEFCVEYMSFDSDRLECIKTGINKKYRKSTITTCAKLSFNSDRIECVKVSGKPYKEGNAIKEIYNLAEEAIWAIEEMNLSEALGIVTDIQDLAKRELRYGVK